MTTLVHSGHKSIPAAHLSVALADELFSCPPGSTAPFTLGQYRILECLGAGGMGKVFRAEHQLMGRQVAIKVMSPTLLSDPESCARFRQEVRLVAQLSHPNIVLAHDANQEQDLHFFVMEYVSGADLGQIVGEYGPLPIPFACECIRQTALGLQHAHEHGLVHCDIKPSNLLLRDGMTSVYNFLGRTAGSERPLIKILDFGLARLAGPAEPGFRPISPESCLCGTPDYMAPELGRDSTTVDIRCDLYSLGCTFSFLLTGQVPYPGGSWSEKLIRHHYDPAVPVSQTRPDVPTAITEIVGRLMAKDPLDRFSTPGEVASAIAAWQTAESLSSGMSFTPLPDAAGQEFRPATPSTLPSVSDSLDLGADRESNNLRQGRTALRRRVRVAWPIAVGLAIAIGLGSAWVICTPLLSQSVRTLENWTQTARPDAHFHLAGTGESFNRLEQAINAASDGDTILVNGNGPFVFPGVSLRGKSLTIRAEADSHPRFDLVPLQKENAWEPLLVANRPLTLEGLHLHYGGEKASANGPAVAHLVYAEGSPLKLLGCKLTGTNAQALVVSRQSADIEIENCFISGNASAVCAELREQGLTRIRLFHNQFEVHDRGAAAMVLWASGSVRDGCELELDENELDGARLLALNNLDGLTSIRANKNTFHFSESVVSMLSRNASQLSQLVRWQGTKNRFSAGSRWVSWNSEALPVQNLADWRKCWNSSETGSLEENTVALPASSGGSN